MTLPLKLVECPRDAMQGILQFIPTEEKIAYLNQLLKVGFDTLDFGSFVSPKAIPQLADTPEVLAGLDLSASKTKLLAIVANLRGAEDAAAYPQIQYLGYPFSISETFQVRNTRKTIAESVVLVEEMQALCKAAHKELVVYISMGFGNPYGDAWSPKLAADWVAEIAARGVGIISLADTVGTADAVTIQPLFEELIPRFPNVEFGAHFHATAEKRRGKLAAAWDGGCRRFDSAMMGFGGCPFAEDELVGNIATESLLEFLHEQQVDSGLNTTELQQAAILAGQLFGKYH
jgi:hydroxymethylglutaryl-CoA lyase